MSKGLEALERIQCNYVRVFKARENGKTQLIHDLNTVKKELEQAQKDKEMLNVFKNALTIEHHDYPMVDHNDSEDTISYFVKELTIIRQNELDKGISKELREWVLKNAFPKELKALEIIKKYYVFEENQFYPFKRKNITTCETKEENDLLKEVLL